MGDPRWSYEGHYFIEKEILGIDPLTKNGRNGMEGKR